MEGGTDLLDGRAGGGDDCWTKLGRWQMRERESEESDGFERVKMGGRGCSLKIILFFFLKKR